MPALPVGVFKAGMIYPVMLVPVKNQSVISHPAVCVYNTSPAHEFLDNRPYFIRTGITDNLGVDTPVSFKNPKHRRLGCASASLTFILASEIALIKFDLTL